MNNNDEKMVYSNDNYELSNSKENWIENLENDLTDSYLDSLMSDEF
jgi:hypothetical protein